MVFNRPKNFFYRLKNSQYCKRPQSSHWEAVKRVFRYFNGIVNLGICFGPPFSAMVIGHSNWDWISWHSTPNQQKTFVFMISEGPTWLYKKKRCAFLSSCKAELVLLCSAPEEAGWFFNLLCGIVCAKHPAKYSIFGNNLGSISSAQNRSISKRNKHIDIRYNFVSEALAGKHMLLSHCRTEDQVSDILTKPLIWVNYVSFWYELSFVPTVINFFKIGDALLWLIPIWRAS